MAVTLTVNGTGYSFPNTADENWGDNVTNWATAVTSGMLQKAGGTFTLTSEVNFGATYGLKSAYYKSQTANPSGTGIVRLGNTEAVSWRNAANSADIALKVNASDLLEFNGTALQSVLSVSDTSTIDLTLAANAISAAIIAGSITDSHINASAAIAYSKLNLAGSIVNADINASAAIAYSKLALTASIVNADVSNSAAIAYSKLNLSSSIVDADISGSAAIAYAKLALSNSIVNADISASAAIAYSKLALTGSIVNADISGSAAIALSKLATVTASRALVSDGSGNISASSVTATEIGLLSGRTGTLATLAGTEQLTNKDIDGGTASNTSRITLPKNTLSNLQSLTRKEGTIVYATDQAKPYFDNGSTLTAVGSGSGSGGINYITNSDAETDVTGWSTYNDGAATRPVDGTAGTVNGGFTWTRTTSTPLRGTASFLLTKPASNVQGHGVSFAFDVPIADRAKVVQLSFDYAVMSGTYSGGTSSTDSDLIAYIYDVTNSTLIEPAPIKLMGSVSGTSYKFSATFQTSSSGSQYRLILHQATTSTSAFTMQFDNFIVGPQVTVLGGIATDWVSFTPTGSWSSNTTYTGKWRRVGDSMEVNVTAATSGAPTSANLAFNLPSGYTIDTNKINNADSGSVLLGSGIAYDSGVASYPLSVAYNSTTSVFVYQAGSGGSYAQNGTVTQAIPFTFGASDRVQATFSVPISGWSSTTAIPAEASSEGRVVAFKAVNATATLSGSYSKVTYSTVSFDDLSAYSSGTYTVRVSGKYKVSASLLVGRASTAAGNSITLAVYKNGAISTGSLWRDASTEAQARTVLVNDIIALNAGDTIEIYCSAEGTTPAITSNTALNYFIIERLAGAAAISAAETVAARYTNGTGAAVANSETVLDFATRDYDTHGAVTTGASWRFTAPVSGLFEVNVNVLSLGSAIKHVVGRVRVGGTTKKSVVYSREVALSTYAQIVVNANLRLLAGEYIDFVHYETSDGDTLSNATGDCSIEVKRVGNY